MLALKPLCRGVSLLMPEAAISSLLYSFALSLTCVSGCKEHVPIKKKKDNLLVKISLKKASQKQFNNTLTFKTIHFIQRIPLLCILSKQQYLYYYRRNGSDRFETSSSFWRTAPTIRHPARLQRFPLPRYHIASVIWSSRMQGFSDAMHFLRISHLPFSGYHWLSGVQGW